MTEIRPYQPSDRPAIAAMHERRCIHDGLGYLLPDPRDPLQFATLVAVEGKKVVAMASGRRIAEGSTVLDPMYGGSGRAGPVRRWMLLAKLIRASAKAAAEAGYCELMAATHPDARGYTARLVRELGFTQDLRNRLYLDLGRGGRDGHP